eukprot:NODE_17121_length_960_cov_4.072029.p1 GENE.NODE_17121_length_960_cov_4.072029~~NODE_17121_length_960_cov_4.072029.p1  ORF type:complete len:260 (-),score=55.24 NODE_17121_length_960_cov_4.072029:131-910(-)
MEWHSIERPRGLHPIFALFDFITCHNIEPDELHVKYMGTDMYFLGSVLKVLVIGVMPGSPPENMKEAWADIVKFYKADKTPTQYSNFDLKSFLRDGNDPERKGKGCEVKDILKPLVGVWQSKMDPGKHEHKLVEEALLLDVEIQDIISDYSSDFFYPPQKARQLANAVEKFLRTYSGLANNADTRGELLWAVTVKSHWFWHLGMRGKYLQTRRGATMLDEDYMGHIKDLVAGCVHGTPSHQVPGNFVERDRWAMTMMYK